METLPQDERYSYEFEGNAQVLDHILVGGGLLSEPLVFDPVHVNAEFWDQASDHDPSVVRLTLNEPPTVSAGGPYSVDEGSSITLGATGDKGLGPLSGATYANSGASPTSDCGFPDGPTDIVVRARIIDKDGGFTEYSAGVQVRNVAPTATFDVPSSATAGFPFVLSLSNPHDPSP